MIAARVCIYAMPPERCVFVHLDPLDCMDIVGLSGDDALNISALLSLFICVVLMYGALIITMSLIQFLK